MGAAATPPTPMIGVPVPPVREEEEEESWRSPEEDWGPHQQSGSTSRGSQWMHKMPGLKQLGPVPQQPKKRPERGALSSLSISAPLGDFRHTLHVGRGGDTFGDTSFLGHQAGGTPPEAQPHPRAPLAAPPSPPNDPLLSFHLDLGPSMLDAVLGVMDMESQGVEAQPQGDPRTGLPPTRACSQQREPELKPPQQSVTSL